jgi:hypothetical protein
VVDQPGRTFRDGSPYVYGLRCAVCGHNLKWNQRKWQDRHEAACRAAHPAEWATVDGQVQDTGKLRRHLGIISAEAVIQWIDGKLTKEDYKAIQAAYETLKEGGR